ncbi:MAG: thioesterase family protein [Myxococcota bacterium]|nr:thioesterase family protein [Myxococcota bacterium]
MSDAAVFLRDGDRIVPTELSQGPWNPQAQHGGAVAGLLMHLVEACEAPVPMRVARLSVDMLREVPLRPLGTRTRVVRTGKRIQLVDAVLHDGDAEVARATARQVRTERVAGLERWVSAPVPLGVPPEGHPPPEFRKGWRLPGYVRAMDFVRPGGPPSLGEVGVIWSRLRVPFLAGEETSPLVRLAAAADFASGAGSPLDFERFVSINPDLTIHVEREPRGEWVGVAGQTELAVDGTGQSIGDLYDLEGRTGRAQASLYVAPRPPSGA